MKNKMKELTEFLEEEGFYNPRIFVDFQNVDKKARVRLNLPSTQEDIEIYKIELKDGLEISMYQEEINIDGIVRYSEEENIWVAEVDWWAIINEGSEVIV